MFISDERHKLLDVIKPYYPLPDVFTTDEEEARIKVVTEKYLVGDRRSRVPKPMRLHTGPSSVNAVTNALHGLVTRTR